MIADFRAKRRLLTVSIVYLRGYSYRNRVSESYEWDNLIPRVSHLTTIGEPLGQYDERPWERCWEGDRPFYPQPFRHSIYAG